MSGQMSGARVEGPVGRLLEEYRGYLLVERRLSTTTVEGYECIARVFLVDRERHHGGLALGELTPADVSGFLLRECSRLSVGGARGMVAKLRPLLVYLHVTGRISAPLRWAVPAVADLQGRTLPRAVDSGDGRRTVGQLRSPADGSGLPGLRDLVAAGAAGVARGGGRGDAARGHRLARRRDACARQGPTDRTCSRCRSMSAKRLSAICSTGRRAAPEPCS